MIDREYHVNFYLDQMPAGLNNTAHGDENVHYYTGIPIGNITSLGHVIYNHYTFNVYYNTNPKDDTYTIVGFNIVPISLNNEENNLKCAKKFKDYNSNFRDHEKQLLYISEQYPYTIHFTYDVIFYKSNIPFSSRWDHYTHLHNDKIHWYGMVNSSLIIIIFSILVLFIFSRALKKDIDIYNTVILGVIFRE